MKKKVCIYITKKGERKREAMKRFFHVDGFDVNGEAWVEIDNDYVEQILMKTELAGYIQIRYK